MNPIVLAPDAPVTHLLQRIRDEAHRFAINFQRNQRKIF
jgi:excinuclease ABC subunit C